MVRQWILSVAGSLQVWCSHDILLEQLQVTCSVHRSSLRASPPPLPFTLPAVDLDQAELSHEADAT